MKKRILAMLLAVAMIFGMVACVNENPNASDPSDNTTVTDPTTGGNNPPVEAGEITIRLHYNRPDGAYEGWNVWFWPYGGEGAAYQFTEENGEMIATYVAQGGVTQVGYIVRLNEWESKDVDADQYISLVGILAGTLDVYVESGVSGQTIQKGADVVEGTAITAATYDGETTVTVTTSSALEGDIGPASFVISNASETATISKVEAIGSTYRLTLSAPLNPMREYNVQMSSNGASKAITMPDYYTSANFESNYTYTGDDLGATYTKEKTTLRVWAPTAIEVSVNLYTNGDPSAQASPVEQVKMTSDVNGTWVATLDGDQHGVYYTYQVVLDSGPVEACDPYARTTGVNGKRAMIIDLDSTDPAGWDTDKDPNYDLNFTDHVIYELHVRDLSSDSSSGIQNVGKFLGLIESGTKNSYGQSTGLDHMVDLGITAVHLLPIYDYASVDESKLDTNQFNWGYDPLNYNVPEGSYSTDPYNGATRVSEMKQMVQGLHDAGISVIMDVVYNHVYNSSTFCFNQIVPDYFSRPNSNGSGCGNDTASERLMVRKYIVESVVYWADEYHIDGFRFDLVGLIDTETINQIIEEVHKTHPNVKFYGEGWTMSTNATKTVTMTTQQNSSKTPEFAFFSDTIRDLLKGGVFDTVSLGFVSGATGKESTLKQCFKGMPSWCKTPSQTINYASCHDNYTLIDRIVVSTPNATWEDQIKMNNLAAAIYMTSQGIPFMQAGEEILRSKPLSLLGTEVAEGEVPYDHNSYNKPDAINSIKWDDLNKDEYMATYNYYKGLIAFRKAHPALRLTNAADVNANVTAVSGTDANVVAFEINGGVNGETADSIFVIFNANASSTTVDLPDGNWTIYIDGENAGTEALGTASGSVTVDGISAMILVKG